MMGGDGRGGALFLLFEFLISLFSRTGNGRPSSTMNYSVFAFPAQVSMPMLCGKGTEQYVFIAGDTLFGQKQGNH